MLTLALQSGGGSFEAESLMGVHTFVLPALVAIPILFAIGVALGPERKARSTAFLGTIAACVVALFAFLMFQWEIPAAQQLPVSVPWMPSLGIAFSMGADSISMLLIGLTVLLGPICVAASATAITERTRSYYAWLLVLQGAMTGVFCARDLVLFYVCFESTLIPMYILIALWGSTNRRKAATKFFLYTFTGSIITLAGLVYVAWTHASLPGRAWTFDIATLELTARNMPAGAQAWVLLALLCGFAVKVPLFPLHTWLPLAHTEAPTAGSVILAGVLLKLGTYGIYRFAMPYTPAAFAQYAPALAVLCLVGILYGGLICWVQTDAKKLVAYSSVAHLGFCVLGLAASNQAGVTGALLYMISHGLSTGALFLMIGMVYERYHTRSMKELGGLAGRMPVWATFMVFFTLASVGLPGLNGFVSEFLCLLGAFQADDHWGGGIWSSAEGTAPAATWGRLGPWYAAIAGVGMVVAAMYLLYMVGAVVWGAFRAPGAHAHSDHGPAEHADGGHGTLPRDLSRREIALLVPLAALCLGLGVYPMPLIRAVEAPVADTVNIVRRAWEAREPAAPGEPAATEQAGAAAEGAIP